MAEGLFRIGELSHRTGLSPDLIRAWERRYALFQPKRSAGNFRLYSVDDLARLRLMQHYMGQGIQPSRAAELVRQAQSARLNAHPGLPAPHVRRARAVLRDALERYDDVVADRLLRRLTSIFPAGAVVRDVVLPHMREAGERWERGQISVAQEHFASSFLEPWMLSIARDSSKAAQRRAVLACLPNERHSLGLAAFAVALRDLGWRTVYLGQDTPVANAAQTAAAVRADALVLSTALPATFAAAADGLREVAAVHPLTLGGAGVNGETARSLGLRVLPLDVIAAAELLSRGVAGADAA